MRKKIQKKKIQANKPKPRRRQKKKIVIKNIPIKKKRVFYWGRELDQRIVEYNTSLDPDHREYVFRKYLDYPLDKMAENIINRFKFPYMEGGFHEVKKQVIGFLVMNLAKYTPDKGKSFSYFSVIAKNYLILHNNIGYKAEKNTMYLSDIEQDESDSSNTIEELPALQAKTEEIDLDFKEFTKLLISYWEREIPTMFPIKRDAEIAYGVLELIQQADKIENHSKKAAFLFLREMTNSKTSYISKVVSRMKKKILQQLREYKTEGHLKNELN